MERPAVQPGLARPHTDRVRCLVQLQILPHLEKSQHEAVVAAALEEIKNPYIATRFDDDIREKIIKQLPAEALGIAVDLACAREEVRNRIGDLHALIPKLDGALKVRALEAFLLDALTLDGIAAIGPLSAAGQSVSDPSAHHRLLRRELVERIHADRAVGREYLLRVLGSPDLLTETVFPRSVLAAFATRLVALYHDWTWP